MKQLMQTSDVGANLLVPRGYPHDANLSLLQLYRNYSDLCLKRRACCARLLRRVGKRASPLMARAARPTLRR